MYPLKPGLIVCLILFCCLHSRAQITCVPVYVNEYSGNGHIEPFSIKPLADGSFLVAGRGTDNQIDSYDGMVMQVSATGTILWSYLIGGPADDAFTGIAPLSDGSFILSGTTASFGHPESKGWLVHISATGTVIWSRQVASQHSGTDHIKAVIQYSDQDIIASFNEDDSTTSSNPVVFKMGLDGTLRWSTKFDNGNDDSFTSIAFAGTTIYASGYYSVNTTKKAVIVQLNAADGSQVLSRNIYRNDNTLQQEIAGLEVYNNIISYGLWLHNFDDPSYPLDGMVLVQTDMSNARRLSVYADNSADESTMTPFRTNEGGFYVLRSDPQAYLAPSISKVNQYGSTSWGHSLSNYSARSNNAVAVTADGGCVAGYYYQDVGISYMNQMRLVRFTSTGENGDCKLPTLGLVTDTLGYSEQPFTWQNISSENLDNTVNVPAQAVNTPTLNNVCLNNLCTDKTPLPPGCNKTSRIEYGGPESQFYRDFVTTLDGGRIAVGEISSDALAVKLDVNGQPLWSKRFENIFHTMKFARVLRTADNNYWLFANDNQTLNNKAASYIDIVKIDESGNILWSQQLDMGYYGLVSAVIADVAQAPDNGFVLMVNDGYGTGSINSYAMRYDANANMIWQKEIIHPGAVPVYKSITCSRDAVFLAYDSYDYSNFDKFGMEKLDLKTGNLVWSNRYSINAGNLEMMNRIFSINDTTYTFVNNFIPIGPFSSVMNSVMVKLDPNGKLIQSLFLNGENMVPASSIYSQDASPPTVVLTSEQDFVMCNRVDVGGMKKMNMARFDKTGKELWSRNFEGMNNHTPMNFHQQGKGFMATGFVDIVHPGNASWKNAFLLKVDSSGKILNNATGDCQQTDRGFYPGPGPVTLNPLPPRQTNDLSGPSFKSINVSSQDVEQDPKAFCIQKANCGNVALKQKGTACSMKDTLQYYLQNSSTCDAAASWQYDTAYFRQLYANGDSILLIPLREGASSVTATFEGNCFLTIQKMNVSILHPASSVNLGPDTILCVGGSLRLSTGSVYASYRWSDNSTDSILTINTSGKYYVEVSDQCGNRATDTILVKPASLGFQITGDTSTCNHTAANLAVSAGYNNYQWTPTDHLVSSGNKVQVNPDVNTRYKVTAEKYPGCIVADSFMVSALTSPPIQLRTDTTLCAGDSLLLQAPTGFLHYTWNTGDSSSFIYAKTKGLYTVKAVYTNGCQSAGTSQVLNVYADPFPNLDKNPVLCEGSVRELSANQAYPNYLWSTGSTARTIPVDTLGTYWLQVQDQNGCFGSDTVDIQSILPTPSAFLSPDTLLCEFQKLTLTSKKLYQDYTWSDQSTGPTLQISRPGVYWLTVKDENGCMGSDTVVVTQKQCSIGLFVPNAFTPDHRGNNEVFRPVLLGNVLSMDFEVFNRWGQRVFQTNQQGQGWDGTIGNMPCAAQTYIWICSYTMKGALPVHEKGTVILIR